MAIFGGFDVGEIVTDLKHLLYTGLGASVGESVVKKFISGSVTARRYAGLIEIVAGIVVMNLSKRVTGEVAEFTRYFGLGLGAGAMADTITTFIKGGKLAILPTETSEVEVEEAEEGGEVVTYTPEEEKKIKMF